MNLRSFGCSFIYGSELSDRNNTWPKLIADKLCLPHQNHGIEGIGNLRIMESILCHAEPDDLCLINWTWIDRFDFITVPTEKWQTIVPSSTDFVATQYYKNLHSQYRDMLTNLTYISTAIDHLNRIGAKYFMTYMDRLLFETVQDSWHPSQAVSRLQRIIKPHMNEFDGLTFLEWSRHNNYEESNLWHPLDDAHAAAADLLFPAVRSIVQ